MVAKLLFDEVALRRQLSKTRKAQKLSIGDAAITCGITVKRLADLERGFKGTRETPVKFDVHEVLSICVAFAFDIWQFTILPAMPRGSSAEQRDRAWAEAQQAWQQVAELKQLLRQAMGQKLTIKETARANHLLKVAGPR